MANMPKTDDTSVPKKIELTQEQFDSLMNRLNAVEDSKTQIATEKSPSSGMDQFGKPIGVLQKFSIDPADYEDPRTRLMDLPEFERFAFKQNFVLDWEVDQTLYDTKYGTAISEPKFVLTLKQKRYDEDGNVKKGLIIRGRGIFFEDPMASIKEAVALGLPITEQNSPQFLSDMRFLRYKFWISEILNPRRPESTKAKVHEEVIAGKVYVIEEYQAVVE